MKRSNGARRHARLARHALGAAIAAAFGTAGACAWAQLPAGGAVVHGSAAIATDGGRMTVTNSPNAVLNWQSFSVGARNSVHFAQQSAASQVLNRVVGNDPSAILGSLSSNGGVWLVNPHGVLFGRDARIDVGGLVASTLPLSNADFLAGRFRFDSGALPGGQVLNQGDIRTSFGGRVWLVGDSVRNEGLVHSPAGHIVLAAGRSIELVDSGIPNVTVRVTAPGNEAVNLGTLLAPGGGTIDVHGGIVNQGGIVRADSIGTDPAGRVVMRALGDVHLGAASHTSAAATGGGSGGQVLAQSASGATLVQGDVSATSGGGKGGRIHLLGEQVGVFGKARVDASGGAGGDEILVGGDYGGANPAVQNAAATYLGPGASVRADATGTGDGGKVILWGDSATRAFGTISARGGPGGGNGGFIETSGRFLDARPKAIDVGAARGAAGTWLLDPGNITIGDGCCSPGGVQFDDTVDFTITSNADDAFIPASVIVEALEAQNKVVVRTGGGAGTSQEGNITVAGDIVVHGDPADIALTLEAHNDIIVEPGVKITAGITPMLLTLTADSDNDNAGGIVLNSGVELTTRGGDILLFAARQTPGSGDGIDIAGSTLDAGFGIVGMLGNTVDIRDGSSLTGLGVGIVSNAIAVSGSALTAAATSIQMSSTAPAVASTVTVADSTLTASSPNGPLAVIDIGADSVTLQNVDLNANGALRLDAQAGMSIGGGTLLGQDIAITAGSLAVRDARLGAAADVTLDTSAVAITEGSEVTGRNVTVEGGGFADVTSASLAATDGDTHIQAGTVRITEGSDISGANIAVVANDLEVRSSRLDAAAGTATLEAFTADIIGESSVSGDSVAVEAGTLNVADSSLTARTGRIGLTRSGSTGGTATLSNAILGAGADSISGAAGIDIVTGALTMLDTDITASGNVSIATGSASIAYANGDAGIRAAGLDIDSGTVELDNVDVIASRANDAIVIQANRLVNRGSQFTTLAGRWLVHLGAGQAGFPAADLGGLDYTFVQVDAGDASPVLSGIGAHGILMEDPLDVRVRVDASRPYDGTTAATFSQPLSHNAGTGIRVQQREGSVAASGAFDSRNAGTNKPVIFESEGGYFDISAANGSRVYGATQSYVADITRKEVTLSGLAAAPKVYDSLRTATLSGTIGGIVEGDSVTVSGATGLFDDKNAGVDKPVVMTGGTLAGADAANYRLTGGATTVGTITPRPITAAGITAADKVYDGTRSATLSGALSGALPGDDVSLDGATGLFDDRNAGDDKPVAISAGSLAGADAANYVLSSGATARAAITPRPVDIALTGQVVKEYDASTAASLGAGQFVLAGAIAGDAVVVGGPAQGAFDSADVGQGKTVRVTGVFQISGADAFNYRVGDAAPAGGAVTATVSGIIGTITPATLVYTATPMVRDPGMPPGSLAGTVTGFKGADSLASATTGVLVWQTDAGPQARPGLYPVVGSGLAALNYVLVQAPGNAVALEVTAGALPAGAPQQAQESSTAAIASALASALPRIDPRHAGSGLLDMVDPAVGRTYGAVRIGAMSQDELTRMIAQRRDFKRKLFADAIYKLELDASLADVQPCATVVEASSGACRITPNQLNLIQADTRLAALAGKASTTGASAAGATGSSANGAAPKAASRAATAHVPQIQRKIAVLFGINDYADKTIPPLENAVPDVDAVSALLADKLGYDVRVVRNPDKADIIRTLNQLSVEVNDTDSVVIYYAGHGFSLEKNGAGYWLPADAQASDPRQWISNGDVARLLSGIRSSQMVLISDSCYSGAFARDGMDAVGRDVTPEGVLAKRSVVVISSGGDEPVADEGKAGHSIFAWNLMEAMRSVSAWKPGSTVFSDVQAGVRKEFPQTPKYGSVTAAGHQAGGDYLFELR